MAGIYIHIPFCRQACHYCNFHFSTSLRYKNELLAALLKETGLQKDFLNNEPVETIYLGGGTPSLLEAVEVEAILQRIPEVFPVHPGAEITLEANPDDITAEKLEGWKSAGINRLSLGIQSFFEEDLQWMNRAHTAKQATDNLQLALQYFDNITIDLIYGTPELTNERWRQNVEKALALSIPHLSCYALTVEPKTPLEKLIREKKTTDINPDRQSEQFLLLMQWLGKAGYEHYEISNFSLPGKRSRHNTSYWQGEKYLGLGPSAHSFNGTERQWNISNNNVYIQSVLEGKIPYEKEVLTPEQQLNEYIMTSLRTIEGISFKILHSRFGIQPDDLGVKTAKYIQSGLLQEREGSLVLTNEGKLLADGIAGDLFY